MGRGTHPPEHRSVQNAYALRRRTSSPPKPNIASIAGSGMGSPALPYTQPSHEPLVTVLSEIPYMGEVQVSPSSLIQ